MSTALKLKSAQENIEESPIMDSPQVRALINSVLANGLDFNGLERELFKILRNLFTEMLTVLLEKIDYRLMCSLKRQGWKVHDNHDKTIISSLGTITFNRRYYKKQTATGENVYAHLLDSLLGLDRFKNITPRLVEMVVGLAAENSYRKSSSFIEEMLEIDISHESIRQEVQEVGRHIAKWDKETGLDGTGRKEVPLLVVEVDGALLKRQIRGKPKKTRKTDKKFELKTAVIYEGWEQAASGKAKLKNPAYFVHGGTGREFWTALERHLARIYCLEGCQRIIVAGDGAAWIRQGAEELGAEYQYCRFHLERDLRKLFGDEVELKKSISKTLQNNDNRGFNMIMDALLVEEKKSEQKKQIEEFRTLINNVWEGITDWRERNKTNPEDARGLGVIEPNVGHTIAKRFKHQGASWSLTGAINLAKVRCAVRNQNLTDLMRLSGPPAVREKTVERIDVTNGYWARKQADGLRKKDPSDWCKASLAAARGPEQRARVFAKLIGQLTSWSI